MERITHDAFGPVYRDDSEILILGTIPSPKSREYGFYYGHPQNRFWKVLAEVYQTAIPSTIEDKIQFLYQHKIALWDVLQSCYIHGAEDATIKEPEANNLQEVLGNTKIKKIYTTGKKAYTLYNKLCFSNTQIEAIELSSTSPANCRMKYDDLVEEYSKKLLLNC